MVYLTSSYGSYTLIRTLSNSTETCYYIIILYLVHYVEKFVDDYDPTRRYIYLIYTAILVVISWFIRPTSAFLSLPLLLSSMLQRYRNDRGYSIPYWSWAEIIWVSSSIYVFFLSYIY